MDIQFMRRLHDKVNIVPVIAKADTLTPKEIKKLKERVRLKYRYFIFKIYVKVVNKGNYACKIYERNLLIMINYFGL